MDPVQCAYQREIWRALEHGRLAKDDCFVFLLLVLFCLVFSSGSSEPLVSQRLQVRLVLCYLCYNLVERGRLCQGIKTMLAQRQKSESETNLH